MKKILHILFLVMLSVCAYATEKKSFIPSTPKRKVMPQSVKDLQSLVVRAALNHQKLSLAGAGTSRGGQIVDSQAVMIDLSRLNKVIAFDKKQKRITVQAGMTWKQLLTSLNPVGLSVRSMQCYADFSIGGSLAVNAHGQDIKSCSVCDTIESIKVLMMDGSLRDLKPSDELFTLIVGGYGLFGIICEVTLVLTDNVVLQKNAQVVIPKEYPQYFEREVKNDPAVALHFAKFTVVPEKFLSELLVVTYKNTSQKGDLGSLEQQESSSGIQKIWGLVEHEWVKKFRLFVDRNFFEKNQKIERNKVLTRLYELEKTVATGTELIVQEYVVPCDQFTPFLTFLKTMALDYSIQLVDATVEYITSSSHCFLNSVCEEGFAFRLLVRVEEDEQLYSEVAYWTQMLIDKATKLGGTYHLAYHLFAPRQLVKNAYPQFDLFIGHKKNYDPQELLINQFYRKYIYR